MFAKCVFASFLFLCAELSWRILRVVIEYKKYFKHYHYKNKLRIVLKHGFHFSYQALYLLAFITTISTAVVSSQHYTLLEIYKHLVDQLHLIPIWCFFRVANFTLSMFDYADFIRSDSGLDYATGMASNYFHGYLLLALSNRDNQKGIAERIEQYENRNGVKFAINRLVILIPNSLHTKPVIKSRLMERQDSLIETVINRAGVSRSYVNDVYRIVIDEKPYYITVEGATPLLSYFEAMNFNLTGTEQMEAMQREVTIKFYRYLKRILEKWPMTKDQCELVFYNDLTPDGRHVDVGEVLCAHIKEIWKNELRY